MKLLRRLITLACILAAPFTHAAEKPAGNAPADAKKTAETRMPRFVSAEQVKGMPPCKATVEQQAPCYSIFRTTDGKEFSIGGPAAGQNVVQFLKTLKNGQTYEFPKVFLDYQKKNQR
jgi:protein-disulfide isomerase